MSNISILITNYNNFYFIEKAIKSVLEQTILPAEIIVVDDCSTDKSDEKIKEIVKEHRWIKYIKNPVNMGVTRTRLIAINNITSKFFMFLDSDDWLERTSIENIIIKLEENPASIVIPNFRIIRNNIESSEIVDLKKFCQSSKTNKIISMILNTSKAPGTGNHFAMSYDSYIKINGYNLKYEIYEDLDLLLRLIIKNDKFVNVGSVCLNYRKFGLGISRKKIYKTYYFYLRCIFENFFKSKFHISYLLIIILLVPYKMLKIIEYNYIEFKNKNKNKNKDFMDLERNSYDNIENLAPVCLFVYERLETLKTTISNLKNNYLAKYTDLIIYSDAPSELRDNIISVSKVREFIITVNGFKSITIVLRPKNLGLSKSIISGVSEQLLKHESVIVLEDDLVTSRNYLNFMNASLKFYKENKKIFTISGFSYDLQSMKNCPFDNGFSRRAESWGWAIWADRWNMIDWSVSEYSKYKNSNKMKTLLKKSGSDLHKMLVRQMNSQIDSWYIRAVFHQSQKKLISVFPKISKVINNGFDEYASNTKNGKDRFNTILDSTNYQKFIFDSNVTVNNNVSEELQWKFSTLRRIYYRLKNILKLNNFKN